MSKPVMSNLVMFMFIGFLLLAQCRVVWLLYSNILVRSCQVDGFINVSNRKTLLQYGTDQKTLHFMSFVLFFCFCFSKAVLSFPYSLFIRSQN